MKTLDEISASINSLPPMPDVALRVMRLYNDPDARVDSIAEILQLDQGMTANVLRLCNSSYYGLSRRVDSIREAIVLLGQKAVVDLMMVAFCSDVLRRPLTSYRLEAGELWRHAVAVAIATQEVCGSASKKSAGAGAALGFTSGLLHDIGKVILNESTPSEFLKIIQKVEEEDVPFEEAERAVLGFSHSEVGARVAGVWRLPEPIIAAIAHHHHPEEAESDHWLVNCVHVGNILSLTMGLGIGVDGLASHLSPRSLEELEIDLPHAMELTATILDKYMASMDMIQQN